MAGARGLLIPMIGIVMLGLAGCGGQDYPWYREGMSASQLKDDEHACAAEARDYSFVNPNLTNRPDAVGSGPNGRVASSNEADLYRTCMNSRGYARVPPPPATTETKTK